jgi:integrase
LVGYAKVAMEKAHKNSDEEYLFSRYIRDGKCNADHASAALNKWLKKDFNGLTAHCLRHTFRDRLRAVECPIDLIDQIGGWRSVSSIGNSYGQGYSLEQFFRVLRKIAITFVKIQNLDLIIFVDEDLLFYDKIYRTHI